MGVKSPFIAGNNLTSAAHLPTSSDTYDWPVTRLVLEIVERGVDMPRFWD